MDSFYRSLGNHRSILDAALGRLYNREDIASRLLAVDAATLAFKGSLPAVSREELAIGRSLAQDLAAASNTFAADAAAAAPLLANTKAAVSTVLKEIEDQALLARAVGLQPDHKALATQLEIHRSAAASVLDHLKSIHPSATEAAILLQSQQAEVAAILRANIEVNHYVENTLARLDWQQLSLSLGEV